MTDERGIEAVTDVVYDSIKDKDNVEIHMEQQVTDITDDGNKVTVTTKAGDTFTADYVLLTVSLGVLQHKVINFSPSLPEWKENAIFQGNMGHYTHIDVKFSDNITAFWDDVEHVVYCPRSRGYYPVFFNYNAKGYFDEKTNIISFTVVKEQAVRIEGLSTAEVHDEVMGVLRNMYGNSIPEPQDILVSRWGKDPLYYGAFSNWPPNMCKSHFENLEKAVGRVYFGGEATSKEGFGFIHGGYESGLREANKILNLVQ